MDELKKILDGVLLKSLEVRPEVRWLQRQHLRFMKENGLTTKKDADGFLYEKMYAALPEQEAQLTKIRFWRTGHHNHHADRFALGTNRDEREQTNGRLSYKIRLRRKHTTTHGRRSRRLLPELKTVS